MKYPRAIKAGSTVVKVYRTKHKSTASGFIYQVAWTSHGARKIQQFTVEDEALDEARLRASQLASGRIDAASIGKPDRDELHAARQIVGTVPLLSALKEWAKAHELTNGHILAAAESWAARNGKAFKRIKVLDVVRLYCTAKTNAGKNVADDHYSAFENMKADLGEFFIDSVSTKQLDEWLAKREHPVSRNTYRKRIVAVWRWAAAKGYLPRGVKTEAEMTERAHEEAPVIGIISTKTFATVLEHFRAKHPEYLAPLAVAGFAGLRRSEIHEQTWEDINLEEKHLRVTKAKRGTPARRLVPLGDAAVEWLMLCKQRKGPICTNLAVDRMRSIARDAKLPTLPENAFRHSFISHKVAATGDIPRVSMDAGNSPKEINRHYRELVTEAEGKAWFALTPAGVGELIPMRRTAS